ncbi:22550_t:CDS:1, partial [Gigaspora margarita]
YIALLFATDTTEIAAIRILEEILDRVNKINSLKAFRYRTGETDMQNEIQKDERGTKKRKERMVLKITEMESSPKKRKAETQRQTRKALIKKEKVATTATIEQHAKEPNPQHLEKLRNT